MQRKPVRGALFVCTVCRRPPGCGTGRACDDARVEQSCVRAKHAMEACLRHSHAAARAAKAVRTSRERQAGRLCRPPRCCKLRPGWRIHVVAATVWCWQSTETWRASCFRAACRCCSVGRRRSWWRCSCREAGAAARRGRCLHCPPAWLSAGCRSRRRGRATHMLRARGAGSGGRGGAASCGGACSKFCAGRRRNVARQMFSHSVLIPPVLPGHVDRAGDPFRDRHNANLFLFNSGPPCSFKFYAHAGLAQLEERMLNTHAVVGSKPTPSISYEGTSMSAA